jgi:hypothetical protein
MTLTYILDLTLTLTTAITYIPGLTLTHIPRPQVNMSCQSKGPYDVTLTYVSNRTFTMTHTSLTLTYILDLTLNLTYIPDLP